MSEWSPRQIPAVDLWFGKEVRVIDGSLVISGAGESVSLNRYSLLCLLNALTGDKWYLTRTGQGAGYRLLCTAGTQPADPFGLIAEMDMGDDDA